MKTCTASIQEKKDYLALLPFGMAVMYEVVDDSIASDNFHNFFLISDVYKTVIISSRTLHDAKVFGSEANTLINQLSAKYPTFTLKVVEF